MCSECMTIGNWHRTGCPYAPDIDPEQEEEMLNTIADMEYERRRDEG